MRDISETREETAEDFDVNIKYDSAGCQFSLFLQVLDWFHFCIDIKIVILIICFQTLIVAMVIQPRILPSRWLEVKTVAR